MAGYYGRVAYHPGACSDFLEVRTVLVPLLAALQAAQCEAEGDRAREAWRKRSAAYGEHTAVVPSTALIDSGDIQ